ncbi:hypothetical protein [Oceanivirga salmonicida]|uniref:hypothetical protein n=1 Tax=Oceanivirga salmonicida TaxID=1769291 RepID=UPI0012E228CC|nr:hypothetical protein [Oceanivirga salmonicida]
MKKYNIIIFLFLLIGCTSIENKYIKPVLNEYEKEAIFTGKIETKDKAGNKIEIFYRLGEFYKVIIHEKNEKIVKERLDSILQENYFGKEINVYRTYDLPFFTGELKVEENGNTYVQTIIKSKAVAMAKAMYKNGKVKYSEGISDFIQNEKIKKELKEYRYEKDRIVTKDIKDEYDNIIGHIDEGRLNGDLIVYDTGEKIYIPYINGEIKGKYRTKYCTYDIEGVKLNGYEKCNYFGDDNTIIKIENSMYVGKNIEIDNGETREFGKYIDGIYVRRINPEQKEGDTLFTYHAEIPLWGSKEINAIVIKKNGEIRKYNRVNDYKNDGEYEILKDVEWE